MHEPFHALTGFHADKQARQEVFGGMDRTWGIADFFADGGEIDCPEQGFYFPSRYLVYSINIGIITAKDFHE
jgi:hypothetical protein